MGQELSLHFEFCYIMGIPKSSNNVKETPESGFTEKKAIKLQIFLMSIWP